MIEKELAGFRKGFKKAKINIVLGWKDEYINPFVSGINTGWGISSEVRMSSRSDETQGWRWQEKFSGHPTPVIGLDGSVFYPSDGHLFKKEEVLW